MNIETLMFLKTASVKEPETEEATATGNPVTFTTGVKKNLVQCKVPFAASQSGSGDPSPSNIRPINGWNALHVYHSGEDETNYDTYTASWTNVYGKGYVDLATGELKITHKIRTFVGASDESWNYEAVGNFYIMMSDAKPLVNNNMCNAAIYVDSGGQLADGKCKITSSKNFNLKIGTPLEIYDTTTFKAWLAEHNVQLLYELATPETIQLTAQQIKTINGENNIWSDSSESLTVTYLKIKSEGD